VGGLGIAPTYAQGERCFSETGQCISGRFRQFWEQHGGLAIFGFPITPARDEVSPDDGRTYRTQWFERARFELHPVNQPPYDVLLGRLGSEALARAGASPTTPAPTEPPERVEFASGASSAQRSGLLPSGPGVKQYVLRGNAGQTMTVDAISDAVPLAMTIESPAGFRWIPEMMPIEGGYRIGRQLTLPETGDYLVTLTKDNHTPSTNYTIMFTIQSPASAPLTPTTRRVQANGMSIAYESFGATDRETMLLIGGVGMQLVDWPIELVEELVRRGYRVVRFDNRDVGLSTKLSEAGLPDAEAIGKALEAGEPPPMPYTLVPVFADAITAAATTKRSGLEGVWKFAAQRFTVGVAPMTLRLASSS
jgi:hypothetical protein